MDTTTRRPQLPALSYLDVDNVKRDEDAQQNRGSAAPPTHHSAPAASPSYQYPPNPPPPYSHPPPRHANSWPDPHMRSLTPPDSRRTSGEESESMHKAARQSLPSISEALGETSFSHPAPTSQPSSQPSHASQPPPAAPASPPSAARRTFTMDPPQPHNPYTSGSTYSFSSFRQDSAGPQTYPPSESKPVFASSRESRPPLHVHTSQPESRSQQPSSYPHAHSTSPQYEHSTSHSSNSMGPPTAPYGYTSYPPKYSQPTTSSQSAGPIYHPSSQYGAPPTPSSSWRSESAGSRFAPDDRATYGESVKRHLDLYDLERALNDIAQTSGIMQDFSRRYGDQAHQNARSGPSISTLPSMVEVDDMINKAQIQLESLTKIREVILMQQAAYEQHIAETQRQHKTYSEQGPPPAEHVPAGMADKDGFSGPDAKKRRGRAAPPGRCHSCNRAETPEWRRGPDGARTLCNACGLHFAKLTRKQNGANKGNVSTSNLRPKES